MDLPHSKTISMPWDLLSKCLLNRICMEVWMLDSVGWTLHPLVSEVALINMDNSSSSSRHLILEQMTIILQLRYMLLQAARAASRLVGIKNLLKRTSMLIGRCNINKINLTMCSGSKIWTAEDSLTEDRRHQYPWISIKRVTKLSRVISPSFHLKITICILVPVKLLLQWATTLEGALYQVANSKMEETTTRLSDKGLNPVIIVAQLPKNLV